MDSKHICCKREWDERTRKYAGLSDTNASMGFSKMSILSDPVQMSTDDYKQEWLDDSFSYLSILWILVSSMKVLGCFKKYPKLLK